MIEQAQRLDAAAGVIVDYRPGSAERIPLPDASVEVVAAAQCWHWFDAPRAAAEFARITKPAGN